MAVRHIAPPTRTNRESGARASRGAEHHPVPHDRRRDDFVRAAATVPQLSARRRIVRAHSALAVDDDLVVIAGADSDWSAPAGAGLAAGPPQWPSAARLERRDERARELVLVQNDSISVQQQGPCGPVVSVHRAEILVPGGLAIEIDGDQSTIAERGVDAFAIGRRSCRGVAVLLVRRSSAPGRSKRLPQPTTIRPSKRKDGETSAAFICGGQENAIAPHDGRRVAATWHRGLPPDVLCSGPRVGIVAARGEALTRWPAPSGPIFRAFPLNGDQLDARFLASEKP